MYFYIDEENATSDSDSSTLVSLSRTMLHTSIPQGTFSYILVGDNLDKNVHPRFMTVDHQTQSLHYFHVFAALDRIDFHHLSNCNPICKVSDLPLTTFLPNAEDCSVLRKHYAILLGRELVKSVPYFQCFHELIPSHIPHKYSNEMSRKSTIVRI